MTDIILKEESYKIIGACMEVHRELGFGFKEIIYKGALEIESKVWKYHIRERNFIRSNIKARFYQEDILLISLYMIQ